MLNGKTKPLNIDTAKDFYKMYRDKPALLLKDHPELKKSLEKKISLPCNIEEYDYFKEYDDWLLDWCFSAVR
jgi:hypothetical protein